MSRDRFENSNKRLTDEKLFVCNKCRCVWEKYWTPNGTLAHEIYPKGNIPRIGKSNKICPRCIEC